MSPEIIAKIGYSYSADILFLGIIFYKMLIGSYPFDGKESNYLEKIKMLIDSDYYKRIRSEEFKFPHKISLHPVAKDLINQLLNLQPSKRPSFKNVIKNAFFMLDAEDFSFNIMKRISFKII